MVTLFQMMTEANFTKLEKREFLQRRSISIPAYPFGSVYKVKAYIKQFRKVSTTDRLIKDRRPCTAAYCALMYQFLRNHHLYVCPSLCVPVFPGSLAL